ncbi:MAG TPA: 4-aminobutyrate--2-oxoglutarate transaminase [Thermoleophilia bacterium]|nr:4-aminobutyrate--2-oxoglutarate transaminase [Thermoleophilia bacterium]
MSNAELSALKAEVVPRGAPSVAPVFIAKARNAKITDVDGREYIDFAAGIGVMNVGHCHPKVVEAVKQQAELYSHTCFGLFGYETYLRLAEKLNRVTPGNFPKRTYFMNSGAEAVETAVKIARYSTGRKAVIAFDDAFHGRTYMTMSLTSQVDPYKIGFGPFAPEVYRVPYAYCYRCPLGLTHPGCGCECAELLEVAFAKDVNPDEVAAVIAEPVQGEGGFIVPPPEYMAKIKKLCDAHGILLIADEIQTGMGRTGTWFGMEHWGVTPDIVTTAKALGAGFPISGITGRKEVMDSIHPGGLGTTYGGNPTACRAGLAVFDIIESEGLIARANVIGNRIKDRLTALENQYPMIGDVRGLGAMVAMELVEDRETKKPAGEFARRLRLKLYENGVVNVGAGTYHNVLRILVPLTIEDATLSRGLDILEETFAQVSDGASAS